MLGFHRPGMEWTAHGERTIMAIAGHISPRMLEHYSHIRMEAKRQALDALSGSGSVGGHGTNDGTKSHSEPGQSLQLAEKYGGDDGTRTRGLCRDRAAF